MPTATIAVAQSISPTVLAVAFTSPVSARSSATSRCADRSRGRESVASRTRSTSAAGTPDAATAWCTAVAISSVIPASDHR